MALRVYARDRLLNARPMETAVLASLTWPNDKALIESLTIDQMQSWYATVDSRAIIFLAQDPNFQLWWSKTYLRKVHRARLWLKVKSFFTWL